MFDIKMAQPVCGSQLALGLDIIADAAAKAYGGGNIISMDAAGKVLCSDKMKDIIVGGCFEDPDAECVRQLIAQEGLPEDGLKTAVLLANEFLQVGQADGIDKQDFLAGADSFLKTAAEKLQEISKANSENLPGGGLYLLNICRPVMQTQENASECTISKKFVCVLEKPFLILAKNAGRQPHEAFVCVKAAAPTQFYSLKQFGLRDGHIPLTEHRDLWRMGIDLQTGKVVDMLEADINVPLNTALSTLKTVRVILTVLCAVRSVL